jgi:hypothetical protein
MSARKVRTKEKETSGTFQERLKQLEDALAKSRDVNMKLSTENVMLRNQVAFMEKLLL